MSIASRARNRKAASPISGRPRLRGTLTKYPKLNMTDWQHEAHTANIAAPIIKTRGAFGGVTKQARKIRDELS